MDDIRTKDDPIFRSEVRDGMLHLNHQPGLGLTPNLDVLGLPLAVYD